LSFFVLCFYDRLPFAFKFCQVIFDFRPFVCSVAAFVDLRFYTLRPARHALMLTYPNFVGTRFVQTSATTHQRITWPRC
jgi:hypothetical protein